MIDRTKNNQNLTTLSGGFFEPEHNVGGQNPCGCRISNKVIDIPALNMICGLHKFYYS